MAVKRSHDGTSKERLEGPESQFLPMFEVFRGELDEHHDRRERIIKASRDITAHSKKIIFALQRVRTLKSPIPEGIAAEVSGKYALISNLFTSIVPDLAGINAWRYQRSVSPGIQEFIEAVSFEHYLTHQELITHAEAAAKLPTGITLTTDDYVLGLFDLIGEIMRFGITGMATLGRIPGPASAVEKEGEMAIDASSRGEKGAPLAPERTMIADLRSIRAAFESLDTGTATYGLGKDVEKKMGVMKTCVEKVETAVYGMIVRGRERPKGWTPDTGMVGSRGGSGGGEGVEGY